MSSPTPVWQRLYEDGRDKSKRHSSTSSQGASCLLTPKRPNSSHDARRDGADGKIPVWERLHEESKRKLKTSIRSENDSQPTSSPRRPATAGSGSTPAWQRLYERGTEKMRSSPGTKSPHDSGGHGIKVRPHRISSSVGNRQSLSSSKNDRVQELYEKGVEKLSRRSLLPRVSSRAFASFVLVARSS